MKNYFNINYEFDKDVVHKSIENRLLSAGSDYICVADGVILSTASRDPSYMNVINGGMFAICDSSFVPLYIKWIYGEEYDQYCGSQIFEDIIKSGKYRMFFMGAQQSVLDGLKQNLMKMNSAVSDMTFYELPFMDVEGFDYKDIAKRIMDDRADIIWVALGAPKQEIFMNRLKPFLNHGVMLGIGAAFKFFSGVDTPRAPKFMVKYHLEFLHRIFSEPKKQIKRCAWIIATLPGILWREWKLKRNI